MKRLPLRLLSEATTKILADLGEEAPPGCVGPYEDDSCRQRFEANLHEIAHHATFYGRFERKPEETSDIGTVMSETLSQISGDANEIDTMAVEVLVSRQLGYPISVAVLVRSAVEAGNFRLLSNQAQLRKLVRETIEDSRPTYIQAGLLSMKVYNIARGLSAKAAG